MAKTAVLLMAFGTPYETSDILDFYTRIRGGHKPPKSLEQQLVSRYQAIGGTSPLTKITDKQVADLQKALDKEDPGHYQVFLGLRFIHPFTADTIDAIAKAGIKDVIGIPLAPQYFSFSSEGYHAQAEAALKQYPDITYHKVKSFWDGKLREFWSNELKANAELIAKPTTKVIFSAHSLPLKIINAGDPYKDEVVNNANAIAKDAGLATDKYTIAWQSAGRTKDEWIGPDFVKVAKHLISTEGIKDFVSESIGFVTDNLEVLYDVDVELKQAVNSLGGKLHRMSLPNTNPLFIQALTDAVTDAVKVS